MIKAPFNYMGSKARHWDFIKKVFAESKKDRFVDIFAGSLTTPLSIKEAFPKVGVLANVKDDLIEDVLTFKPEQLKAKYLELLDIMTEGGKISIKGVGRDKERFNHLRNHYKSVFYEHCPCCGQKQKKKRVDRLTHTTANLLCDIQPKKVSYHSLGHHAFNQDKLETLENWLNCINQIEVTHDYFDDKKIYHDSFIHLDPPYLETMKKKAKGFTGYQYSTLGDGGVQWGYEDNQRLIDFIGRNLKYNNTILLWGSHGNHLESLVHEYLDGEYYEFHRRTSIIGKRVETLEYAFLIQ